MRRVILQRRSDSRRRFWLRERRHTTRPVISWSSSGEKLEASSKLANLRCSPLRESCQVGREQRDVAEGSRIERMRHDRTTPQAHSDEPRPQVRQFDRLGIPCRDPFERKSLLIIRISPRSLGSRALWSIRGAERHPGSSFALLAFARAWAS
jgi:hypothetical protein